jgi:diadenosine hexaphosphate hydrolase (ATP-forming)
VQRDPSRLSWGRDNCWRRQGSPAGGLKAAAAVNDTPVPGAGGIVRNPAGDILLIRYPTTRGGGWTFPKGHVETGESLEVTALREVLEECGVTASIERPLGTTEYTNARGIKRLVHWFTMTSDATTTRAEPGFQARFMPRAEAARLLAHAEDRALLQRLAREETS